MSLIFTLKTIVNHPLNKNKKLCAIKKFFWWQCISRLSNMPLVYSWIGESKLIVKNGDTGLTGNIYCELHEYEDMNFLLDQLSANDLFVDIGSNLGSYTVLAGKVIGSRCISIEPIPSTFERLLDNISINRIFNRVTALNIGLSDKDGELYFTQSNDTENHVVENGDNNAIKVPVKKIDSVLVNKNPKIIKIDVEGYELPVMLGASKTLDNVELKSVIMELNGSGSRYGFDEQKILEIMHQHNFKPYFYDVKNKQLNELFELKGRGNVIFHRD